MSVKENIITDIDNNEERLNKRSVDFYLSDFWRGFVKFWWIGVLCAVLFGGGMFFLSYSNYTPKYTATATFTVHTQNSVLSEDGGMTAYSFYYDRGSASQLASVFPYVLKSDILQKQICRELGVDSMPATVSVTCVDETNMITLTTEGNDPQLTYDTLMSVTKNYSKVSEYIIGQTKLVMITPAVVPTKPSNTLDWKSNTFQGAFIGILIGMVWIFIYGIMRRTIRTKEDIRQELNQKCIGVVPQVFFKKYRSKIDKNILITNPLVRNAFLESIRLLRDSVHYRMAPEDKVLMVTSTAPSEGKSVITVNIAAMYAKNNSRVLIIDCDLRNSGIKKLVSVEGLLEKYTKFDEKRNELFRIYRDDDLNMDFLFFSVKEKGISKFLRVDNIRDIVDSLRDAYDLIFIDTPPCGMISDAAIIASAADVALYVIRQDMVMQTSIKQGLDILEQTDIRMIGCILNGTIGGIGGYGSTYGYGYGYSGYKKYYRYDRYYGKYGYGKYGYGKKSYGSNRKTKKDVKK